MGSQPRNYGKLWSREELILAFDLYCRIPFQQTKASHREVQELAQLLDRTSAAVARKLGNFGAFDPELKSRNISGLGHAGKLDRRIWDEFHNDWNQLVFEAHQLRDRYFRKLPEGIRAHFGWRPSGAGERRAITRQRVHQSFFRAAVLSSYDSTCCVTRIRTPECLIAGHIVPWSVDEKHRTDPTNGLCMSATFDRLFDSGLMTITEDLRVRMSQRILQSPDSTTRRLLATYHGARIHVPLRFGPSQERLDWHRANRFVP